MRGLRKISGPPADIAVRLRREILAEVGLPITVGAARTKVLAKVASGVAWTGPIASKVRFTSGVPS